MGRTYKYTDDDIQTVACERYAEVYHEYRSFPESVAEKKASEAARRVTAELNRRNKGLR